jgi:hypothetical protein
MTPRRGATLVEVLVALTVMALGMLSLLTLFPLGLLTMSQAIKDDRTAHAAANAEAVANLTDLRNDPLLFTPPAPNDVFVRPFPGPSPPDLSANPGYDGPSYPVYVDPYGLQGGSRPLGRAVVRGGSPFLSPGVPRRNVGFVANAPRPSQALYRWFTLQDDMVFARDGPYTGLPCPPGGVVQREGRYSWAYLLCRPRCYDRSVVELTVVVYEGRPILPSGELAYSGTPGNPVQLVPNTTSVLVTWDPAAGQEKPPVRPGSWVFDATVVRATGRRPPAAPFQADPHGFFYRVVGVSEVGNVNGFPATLLEVSPPIRAGTGQGVLVVMETVVEVFERGPGWKP